MTYKTGGENMATIKVLKEGDANFAEEFAEFNEEIRLVYEDSAYQLTKIQY